MTESEAHLLVSQYQALVDDLVAARGLNLGDEERVILRAYFGGTLSLELIEPTDYPGCGSRFTTLGLTGADLLAIEADDLSSDEEKERMWPLTPWPPRRPRDARGRFLSERPE